ncbi:MAG: methionine ABC transporter permease [Butyricicoccus sp.]
MQEFLNNIIPNVMAKLPDFYAAIGDTLLMVVWSGAISFVLGLALGVLITVTKPGGILENKIVYQILDKLVSLFRSILFIILLTWVMPVSRAIMGTAIYVRGAIVPLVFGAVPFFTRQVESALAELDGGLIEAALSMGSTPLEIIFRVYLKESVAAIARGTTITAISLLNLTAMAGVVGAGGLATSPSVTAMTATCWTLPTSLCWSSLSLFVLWSSLAARSSRRTRIKECLT